MNCYKIKSIALMALLASITSFAAGCYYQGYDRYDYARRGDRYDRTYDRRYDSRDNRYAWRGRDRDHYND
jgi:hypothetical protein